MITQMTISNKPKFKFGDVIFSKSDVEKIIILDNDSDERISIDHGIIVGVESILIIENQSGNNLNIEYKDGQVIFNEMNWRYKVILNNGLLYEHYDDIRINNEKFKKFDEYEIELISNLNGFVKEIDFKKLKQNKIEKLEKDEKLAKRILQIQSKFMY
jgi:hypothetical protein